MLTWTGRWKERLERLDTRVIASRDRPQAAPRVTPPAGPPRALATRAPLAELRIFRLVRAVPQVGFVVIAGMLLADLAVLGNGLADRRVAAVSAPNLGSQVSAGGASATPAGSSPSPVLADVGPPVGHDVRSYIVARQDALRVAARAGEPGATPAPVAAVVSFSRGVRPSELRALNRGAPISQVLIHLYVPGRPTPAAVVPVSQLDIPTSLGQAIAPGVVALQQQAIDSQHQADTTVVRNDADQAA